MGKHKITKEELKKLIDRKNEEINDLFYEMESLTVEKDALIYYMEENY